MLLFLSNCHDYCVLCLKSILSSYSRHTQHSKQQLYLPANKFYLFSWWYGIYFNLYHEKYSLNNWMNFEKPAGTYLGQDFYVAFLLFIWRYILGMTILLILFFDIKNLTLFFINIINSCVAGRKFFCEIFANSDCGAILWLIEAIWLSFQLSQDLGNLNFHITL